MDYAFNAQADEMLNKAMDELQGQLDSAEATFESDGRYLEIKAKYANCNDMAVLGDIMSESRRITDELYARYEALVRAANSICKPLADEGVAPSSLKRVVDFMKHINSECSTLGSNYSASVNDYSLGNIASTRYSPTAEARMIETNWSLLHSMHPQVAEEKKRAEEAAAKARAEREERERIEREKAIEEYPQKLAEWEKECAVIEARRKELLPAAKKKAEEQLRNEYRIQREKTVGSAQSKIRACEATIAQAKTTLKTAKFFDFAAKLDANKRQVDAMAEMHGLQTIVVEAEQLYAKQLAEIDEALEKAYKQAQNKIEKENPLPAKPRDPQKTANAFRTSGEMTAVQLANNSIKEAIYRTLEWNGGLMCITEIMEECPECADLSNQRVSALVRQLVYDGLIERVEEKRLAYFRIAE